MPDAIPAGGLTKGLVHLLLHQRLTLGKTTMATFRVIHSKNYTCISNGALQDDRLSLKARGLHHLLLSYPDDWAFSSDHLVSQSSKDGRTALSTALKELEQFGYVVRRKTLGDGGRFAWESVIYEIPPGENSDAQTLYEYEQVPQTNNPQPGFIYLIQAIGTSRYKIGLTADVGRRVSQLSKQSVFPLRLIATHASEDMAIDELFWHQKFADHRVHGEWFDLSSEQVFEFSNSGTVRGEI